MTEPTPTPATPDDTSIVRYDTTGARYIPEAYEGMVATYLTAEQANLLYEHEMRRAAAGETAGPTWTLAIARHIHQYGPPPLPPGAAMVSNQPDGVVRVPLCPEPGRRHVALNGAECGALADAYLHQAQGQPPVQEWQMVERARRLADLAASLDPKQFGHLQGSISPRVLGQA